MCHNMPVTVERDVQLSSSTTPRDVNDAKQEASQSAGELSFREGHSMPGTLPADAATTGQPSDNKPKTIREFERALQTLGFSKHEAKAVASGGFKAIHPSDTLAEQIDALAQAIARHRTIFD